MDITLSDNDKKILEEMTDEREKAPCLAKFKEHLTNAIGATEGLLEDIQELLETLQSDMAFTEEEGEPFKSDIPFFNLHDIKRASDLIASHLSELHRYHAAYPRLPEE